MLKKEFSFIHFLISVVAGSIITLVFNAIFPSVLHAQVKPAEGSKLNYRIIGFRFPKKEICSGYVLEIAAGNFNNNEEFASHLCQTVSSDENKVIAEVPSFGSEYTWQVLYNGKKDCIASKSELYHFSTGALPSGGVDTRLRVKAGVMNNEHSYILLDGNKTMFDMDGNPVWYLPGDYTSGLRDVKVSLSGTITFIDGKDAFDIKYSGKTLWRTGGDAKSDSAVNMHCHHEFNKLSNGHYMCLTAARGKADQTLKESRVKFFPTLDNSTLSEYDRNGSILWSWEVSKYIQQSDLCELYTQHSNMNIDMHVNAFFFDEKDSVIFIGMAGISRIVKIQYPSGKVIGEYGNAYVPLLKQDSSRMSLDVARELLADNKQFRWQHAVSRSDSGFLYIYNNNFIQGATTGKYPHILKMRESGNALEKVWDFNCNLAVEGDPVQGSGGGNVVILPDNSLFISMCSPYGDIFIVNENRDILWSAVAETYQPDSQTWDRMGRYRASIVSRAQLEHLIWNDETISDGMLH